MANIEPGEKFTIGYGNGHKLEVVALNMRQRRQIIGLLSSVQNAADENPVEALEAIEKALGLCCPDLDAEFIDSLDEEMAMQIVQSTMEKAGLSEDERGK